MKIPYTDHISWRKTITEDAMADISKSNQKRLRSTVASLPDSIKHQILPISDELINWFVPLYTSTIESKNNPKVINVAEEIQKKQDAVEYFILLLIENGERIGATIFSKRKTFLSIAYRIYPPNWSVTNTPASPTLYSEYLICQHAYEEGYKKLSHGRDRNPYGKNASIGLAIFKLSSGCKPYVGTKEPDVKVLDTDDLTEDIFIVSHDETKEFLNSGFLICSRDTEDKYIQVTKYPEQIKVETIYRD